MVRKSSEEKQKSTYTTRWHFTGECVGVINAFFEYHNVSGSSSWKPYVIGLADAYISNPYRFVVCLTPGQGDASIKMEKRPKLRQWERDMFRRLPEFASDHCKGKIEGVSHAIAELAYHYFIHLIRADWITEDDARKAYVKEFGGEDGFEYSPVKPKIIALAKKHQLPMPPLNSAKPETSYCDS